MSSADGGRRRGPAGEHIGQGSSGGSARSTGLTKVFRSGRDEVVAVDGIDLELHPGEAVSIVGRNGAGKSTLVGLIAGVIAPTRGTVRRTGRTSSLLELGAGFQPDLTGRENLDLALRLAEVERSRRARATAQALELAGIGDAVDRPVRHLSSGMLARLSLAAALAGEPQILLVDEVLAVGDAAFQRTALASAAALVAEGTALVLVTHSPELAAAATQRTVWLERGRVVEDGPAGEVLARYEESVRGWGRATSATGVRITRARLEPAVIEPGDGVRVVVDLHAEQLADGHAVRLEVRPAYGADSFWMREREESAAERTINLVAWSRPMPLGRIGPGDHLVVVEVPTLPITPTLLEVGVVVSAGDGTIVDEVECSLQVGDEAMRPFYVLPCEVSGR